MRRLLVFYANSTCFPLTILYCFLKNQFTIYSLGFIEDTILPAPIEDTVLLLPSLWASDCHRFYVYLNPFLGCGVCPQSPSASAPPTAASYPAPFREVTAQVLPDIAIQDPVKGRRPWHNLSSLCCPPIIGQLLLLMEDSMVQEGGRGHYCTSNKD